MIVSAQGNNVRNCLAAARRLLGVALDDSRETCRSGGEDGLYRVHLANGDIVEVLVIPFLPVKVKLQR
jgi:hypothetical protein